MGVELDFTTTTDALHFHTTTITSQESIKTMASDQTEQPAEEDFEEKARLIGQVLELQNTLEDLSSKVDNVKEENMRLQSENQVLGQYIENLMTASQVFQTTEDPRSPRYK